MWKGEIRMTQTYEYIEKVDKAINKLVPELVLDQLGLKNHDSVKCKSLKVTAKDVQFGDLAQMKSIAAYIVYADKQFISMYPNIAKQLDNGMDDKVAETIWNAINNENYFVDFRDEETCDRELENLLKHVDEVLTD